MSRPQSISPPYRAAPIPQGQTPTSHAKRRRRNESNGTPSRERFPGESRGSGSRTPPVIYQGHDRPYEDQEWQEDEYSHKRSQASNVPRRFTGEGQEGWTYHLEVIQQPQRARACGFGNKDRRPLSPPPIIRLWIRTASGAVVDPSTIDPRFMILMVDLWSADQQQERNVVMHPVSAGVSRMESPSMNQVDLPPVAGPSSRPSTGTSRPMSGSSAGISSWSSGSWRQPPYHSPAPPPHVIPYPHESPKPPYHRDNLLASPANVRSPHSGWSSTRPPPPPPFHRTKSYGDKKVEQAADPPRPKTAPSPQHPLSSQSQVKESNPPLHSSDTPKSQISLPPLSSIAEERPPTAAGLTLPALQAKDQTPYRPSSSSSSLWNRPRTGLTDASTAATDYTVGSRPISSSSSSWFTPMEQGGNKDRPSSSWSEMRPWSSGLNMSVTRPSSSAGPVPTIGVGIAPPSPHSSQFAYSAKFPDHHWPPTPGSLVYNQAMHPDQPYGGANASPWDNERSRYLPTTSAQPAAQYSRVLVGKVTATCHKLQDEEDKPGLYFFAADLGIRTEGTFTLRMMMTDITSLMNPEVLLGAKAPVLAETFSEPFTVFSAKRFPGVIPTTNLTKVFASQGVKLSVRETKKGGGGGEEAEDDDED
ncbi:uncharacterized protein I303_102732 [Kwoniella dejecticola CBS 10117]|uniref:Velvet domain-containing protein n=1 Tax=Kwoniella dejecticola CBS 10117 TaxID=1296121 RepID=A0A1A6A9K4_9TREE|nr:uncharacterized protein I303_02747 [Kwoniella dejecticola CBS 10117]OBR86733.1 hypothetical protein I303_02747 [Kwoniella dejecticola CBS 10117]